MPYGASGLTVTVLPVPLSADDVGLVDGEEAAEPDDIAEDAEPMPAGTDVASAPSRTLT